MPQTIKYADTICFSSKQAEHLNGLAFQVNHSLFLFAYYEPKAYMTIESWQGRFRTAIVNLYGLLWDCGPFLQDLMKTNKSILWIPQNWNQIQMDFSNLKLAIGAFRSIFCHNCAEELSLNSEHYKIAEMWIDQFFPRQQFGVWDLDDVKWEPVLEGLTNQAQMLVDDLKVSMNCLLTTSNHVKKSECIDWWQYLIAETYSKNPEFLLHAMAAFFQLYCTNGGDVSVVDSRKPLRSQTIQWLVNVCGAESIKRWHTKWINQDFSYGNLMRESNELYVLVRDWPSRWARWNGSVSDLCMEPPLPAGDFFKILANDVYTRAQNAGAMT